MADQQCESCLVKDLNKLQQLLEKRMTEKLPAGVRDPLMEAKRQLRLALRGLITHIGEEADCEEKQPGQVRSIKVE